MVHELAKTGIPGLDAVTGGGIPRAAIVTLSGPTGSGKTTFGMQFLVEGASKYKEPGLFISIEEPRKGMLGNLRSYNWPFEKLEKEKKFMLLDYPIYEVDQFLSQNSAISEIVATLGIKRVVVDSIASVALHFSNEDERKKGFLKLVDNIRKWGATTIVISEDIPSTTQDVMPDTRYGIETLTDGWIHLYYLYSPQRKERTRAIEILKMKGVQHSSKIFPCSITAKGFIIHIK